VSAGIRFFSEKVDFLVKNKGILRSWLRDVIRRESGQIPDLNYIFCTDQYFAEMNLRYLDHDTLTDILTFPGHSESGKIAGDIYISIDRVKENAERYGQPFEKELARIMVHGVLHLLGYKDKKKQEKELMTGKEDIYLDLLFRF
jgi:probable rRNA maturation factor